MLSRITTIIFLPLILLSPSQAQSLFPKERARHIKHVADSIITAHRRTKVDTNFVVRPSMDWNIRFRTNLSGNDLHVFGTDGTGVEREYRLSTDMKSTVGFTGSYRGISLTLSLSPSKIFKGSSDKEFNINYYGRKLGIDLQMSDYHTLSANNILTGEDVTVDGGRFRSISVDGYWVFNNRKFSFPAVFNNSWIQKRSAGSWLAGLSFYVGEMDNNGDYSAQKNYTRIISHLNMAYVSLGGGYAYNFVPNHHWLLHVSAQPHVMVWKQYTLYIDEISTGEQFDYRLPLRFPEVFLMGHLSATYSWGRYYIGANAMIQNTLVGTNTDFHMRNTKWKVRMYFGFRI